MTLDFSKINEMFRMYTAQKEFFEEPPQNDLEREWPCGCMFKRFLVTGEIAQILVCHTHHEEVFKLDVEELFIRLMTCHAKPVRVVKPLEITDGKETPDTTTK